MKVILFLITLLSNYTFAECVHERLLSGFEIDHLKSSFNVYVETKNGIFKKVDNKKIIGLKLYKTQLLPKSERSEAEFSSYNKRFIEYYRFKHIVSYLKSLDSILDNHNYKIEVIGKSLRKRNLYAVYPKKIDPNKKTIIMFGRHHGDEGTANWIIEGFVNEFFNQDQMFHEKFQLILYPMINPDGAEAMSRYNDNGRDLNRSWDKRLEFNYDEVKLVHTHLKKLKKNLKQIPIVLDMHGSFTEDFIYRVDKNFKTHEFYKIQQTFIDQLSSYDTWQNGLFKISNGHKKMARIVMINDYNLNALTHETPRDIKLNQGRDKGNLFVQGYNILDTIKAIY